jgi:hypothetical protein
MKLLSRVRPLMLAAVACILLGILPVAARQAAPAAAQFGQPIAYGTSLIASLGQGFASALYTFEGSQEDLVQIRAIATSGSLNPDLSLIGPNQQPLITATTDLYSTQSTDAALAYYLPQTGTYTLVVSAAGGTAGEYLLQITARLALPRTDLPREQGSTVTVPQSGVPVVTQFTSTESCPTTLTVSNRTAGSPFSFPYLVRVRDTNGQLVGQMRGGRQLEDRISFFAESGTYEVELSAISGEALEDGTLLVSVTCFESQPTCELPVLPPPRVPTLTPSPTPSSGQLAFIQQAGTLEFFQTLLGVIGEGSPQLNYQFAGRAGQLVSVQVIGISFGFDPQLVVIGPSGQIIAESLDDQFSFNPTDASVDLYLPFEGVYNVLVSGENGTGGSYLVRVNDIPFFSPQELAFGDVIQFDSPPRDASVAQPNPPQYFQFDSRGDCPTTLVFTNLSEGDPFTFPFKFSVRDEEGMIIAQMIGGRQTENRVIVAANSGTYVVEVLAAEPNARGQLSYRTTCAGEAILCEQFVELPEQPLPPAPTRSSTPTPSPTATRVRITWTFTPTPSDTPFPTDTPQPPPPPPPTDMPTSTPIPGFCGDGICTASLGEDIELCPADCGCNNNTICEPGRGEDAFTCPDCVVCGNGICESPFEDDDFYDTYCSEDCFPSTPDDFCGDGICGPTEDFATCSADCLG